MLINYQNLENLPVITKSGTVLGKISGLDLETESQTVINYYVKSKNLVKGLFKNELIIKKAQIISIDEKKIVVDDNVCLYEEEINPFKIKTTGNEPAVNTIKTIGE
jgi:sporulation protein YlmC with PRC-barrel domain